jgi:hypothetical protein
LAAAWGIPAVSLGELREDGATDRSIGRLSDDAGFSTTTVVDDLEDGARNLGVSVELFRWRVNHAGAWSSNRTAAAWAQSGWRH